MSSPEKVTLSSIDKLPPAVPSMWRALKRAYAAQPVLLGASFGLTLLAALPDSLLALWTKLLADGLLGMNRTLLFTAATGLGLCACATWFLRVISERIQRRFQDLLAVALESHVAQLQASVATIVHHERPEYLDRLTMLRDRVFVLDHIYMSLFLTCGWILRLAVTLALLMSVHPALVLLALFALPTVLASTWRPGVERRVEERAASLNRLTRHLFDLATSVQPAKEVRMLRIGDRLVRQRREAWEGWYKRVSATRWTSAAWHMLTWAIFGAAYVGAVVFVSLLSSATAGAVFLVLTAGSRLSGYVSATVGEIGFLRGFWLEGSRRLAWLEDYAASTVNHATLSPPEQLMHGIRLEDISFAYPGTAVAALRDVNLHLKPGSVVAIVGENGAGKSTLMKLLCGMYRPDQGRILVDNLDLAQITPDEWRLRLAGTFQDFFRFEFRVRSAVGLGDMPRLDDECAVYRAIGRAGAEDVVDQLSSGLETQLGSAWPEGTELSFGEWQKLALARGLMRDNPLLLLLDEPTAALDAETEHALFLRYSANARAHTREGRVTILVSHRFSTVRMADEIVVLNAGRVVEVGTHEELMARRGQYAELYSIQADGYRLGNFG